MGKSFVQNKSKQLWFYLSLPDVYLDLTTSFSPHSLRLQWLCTLAPRVWIQFLPVQFTHIYSNSAAFPNLEVQISTSLFRALPHFSVWTCQTFFVKETGGCFIDKMKHAFYKNINIKTIETEFYHELSLKYVHRSHSSAVLLGLKPVSRNVPFISPSF